MLISDDIALRVIFPSIGLRAMRQMLNLKLCEQYAKDYDNVHVFNASKSKCRLLLINHPRSKRSLTSL